MDPSLGHNTLKAFHRGEAIEPQDSICGWEHV